MQFTVSNFRALRAVQTVSFAASNYDKSLPENFIAPDFPGLKGQKWLKGIAFYGPNAGGKTSVIEALEALAKMVKNSAGVLNEDEPITEIEPFGLSEDSAKEPTGFGVVFVAGGTRFEYRVAATRQRVWHESLRAFPKTREQIWFSRDWNSEKETYLWTPESPAGYRRDPHRESYTLKNVLFLSKAISLGDEQLKPVFQWFNDRLRFFDLSQNSEKPGHKFTAKQFEDETELAPKIRELIRHADLGVEDIELEKEATSDPGAHLLEVMTDPKTGESLFIPRGPTSRKVKLLHGNRSSSPKALPWSSESRGTHRLFSLVGPWLEILKNGDTVCIDELETSMHPGMVVELLRLFFQEKTNPKGAQILFTTHNPLLLDPTLLRRDQIWFADKDKFGEAHLYPLTDYAPRKGESLVRGYLAGRYGAVPFIPEGLFGSFAADTEVEGGEEE